MYIGYRCSNVVFDTSICYKDGSSCRYITSTEAELFAIRCGINQACSKNNISKIIIITDSIHAAKKIFESSSHPYQLHMTSILQELCRFFAKNQNNSIKFWECPSCLN